MEDPRRRDRGNIRHKQEDIIIIGLCTLICGGEDFPDMEEFGKEREESLRRFPELPNGIPDSDTFRRVFERIEPEALSECLYDWLGCHLAEGSVIAVGGKTICGSGTESHKAYHMAKATITKGEKTSVDTRYFLSSVTDLEHFAYAVRKHWAIENQLHWYLDVIFDEDSSRARKVMSPLNLHILRKTALALCKNADFALASASRKNALLPL